MLKYRLHLFHFYKLLNALSIDVALGACIMAFFVAAVTQVSVSLSAVFSLGISVLLIYTFDHLMDAKRIVHIPNTYRHKLHQKHFYLIRKITHAVGAIQLFLLFYLPLNIVLSGLLLASIVGVYFFVLGKWRLRYIYHKEFLVALIYSVGVFLPSLESGCLRPESGILFLQIFLLAVTNLLIFSIIEVESDRKDQQLSLALVFRAERFWFLIYFLICLSIGIAFFVIVAKPGQFSVISQLVIIGMNIVLALLAILPQSWREKDVHRMIGDAVFYLPLLYLLVVE